MEDTKVSTVMGAALSAPALTGGGHVLDHDRTSDPTLGVGLILDFIGGLANPQANS